jgi:hypothetical protein
LWPRWSGKLRVATCVSTARQSFVCWRSICRAIQMSIDRTAFIMVRRVHRLDDTGGICACSKGNNLTDFDWCQFRSSSLREQEVSISCYGCVLRGSACTLRECCVRAACPFLCSQQKWACVACMPIAGCNLSRVLVRGPFVDVFRFQRCQVLFLEKRQESARESNARDDIVLRCQAHSLIVAIRISKG